MNRSLLLTLLLSATSAGLLRADPASYADVKARAEAFYAEHSYSRAHDLYLQLKPKTLPAPQARWVEFRLADTLWRSQAASRSSDPTVFDRAKHQLEVLVRDRTRIEDHDRVWAEVEESLGDFFGTRRQSRNWSEALPHYRKALDWWAGSPDLNLARSRYLSIVWTMSSPPNFIPYNYFNYYQSPIPLDILRNAVAIARTTTDQAHAHFLLAVALERSGANWRQRRFVPEEFKAALKAGRKTPWYDDALFEYAQWMAQIGRVEVDEHGQWRQHPDFPAALKLYRRLTTEFSKGETRYFDQAKRRIAEITSPVVEVRAGHAFLPDSRIQLHLNWRNVDHIDLRLYALDLTRDVPFPAKSKEIESWLNYIQPGDLRQTKAWTEKVPDKGDYRPGRKVVPLDFKLPVGAYLVVARGGDRQSRDLLLVTDAALVLKTSGKKALVYTCNALEGSPLSRSRVTLWIGERDGRQWFWRQKEAVANADGLASFDLPTRTQQNLRLFAAAKHGARQSFAESSAYLPSGRRADWRLYAFTDRPAYRPENTVHWELFARQFDGAVYSTPANETLQYQITDPRGAKVKEGKVTLNAFGSAWADLALTKQMPLGEYRVTFFTPDPRHSIGGATLFRLEEYKLPEFKVLVQTPKKEGKRQTFLLGDKVRVNIQADYYFGGPVANAAVEVIVRRQPFYHHWEPPHEFPWFYRDTRARFRRFWGAGQEIKREHLKTDATGKATLEFDTPAQGNQDLEYRVEARVTDASRREITATDTVRVTRQSYYVYLRPRHRIHRPQDPVTIEIKTQDANNQPVTASGEIKVSRERWHEIWIDPNGDEITGTRLVRFREQHPIFPPPPPIGSPPWRLKSRGYETEEILTRRVKTDADGKGEFTFTPDKIGYYVVNWSSRDRTVPPSAIESQTSVWVTTRDTTELGFHDNGDGVKIIIDKDTFHQGQTAPVMISTPTSDRYVLFTVEAETFLDYRVVHVTGNVKLIELPISEKDIPNIFLSATLVSGHELYTDTQEVVVPPVKNFLQVELKTDKPVYQPRERGTLTVTTRDHDGHPVSGLVALGVTDQSVFYIQSDYAGDPRQFFFGSKRNHRIQTSSTFNEKSYARLVENEKHQLEDAQAMVRRLENEWWQRQGERLPESLRQQRLAGKRDYYFGSELALGRRAGGGFGGGGGGFGGGALGLQAGAAPRFREAERPVSFAQQAIPTSGLAAPPPGAAPVALDGLRKAKGTGIGNGPTPPAVQVRTNFRATAFWQPDVLTGPNGKATVHFTYPDSLTAWQATARVLSHQNQFGIATVHTRTRQPLIVRLEAPRFFLVGDRVTLSAVVNNNTGKPMDVATTLKADGLELQGRLVNGHLLSDPPTSVRVEPHGEYRFDWQARVTQTGTARLKAIARSAEYADAMEKTYPVYDHGLKKLISKSGKMRDKDLVVHLDLPKDRQADSTRFTVQITPSLAVTMLDALPYLIHYPYGCTEQTMSRFLPAVITAKTLHDLHLKPEDVMGRVFGGIESASAAKTHPKGKTNLDQLEGIVRQGLDRLYDFQHSDGGWGWWKDDPSDHFMSAYVLWGLSLAHDAGTEVKPGVLAAAARYLTQELVEEESQYDRQAWMLHALAVHHALVQPGPVPPALTKALDNLWENRDRLNAYTRALLALAAHDLGANDKAKVLVRNLEDGVQIDQAPEASVLLPNAPAPAKTAMATAHWGEDGLYWRWSEGGVEATAFALKALLAVDPKNKLIEPVTNWLIKNRRGAQWNNTRDTAIVLLALDDYLRQSGELHPNAEYELEVNGAAIAARTVTGEDVFQAPSRYVIKPSLLRNGPNEVHIHLTSGHGPLYFSVTARFVSLEDPITPSGHEIFLHRRYYKLVPQKTLLKGYVQRRFPLDDGDTVRSGERVETVLTVEAKNNYQYLMLEDLKPAGFESVALRSGASLSAKELKSATVQRRFGSHPNKRDAVSHSANPVPPPENDDYTGRRESAYRELRDRRTAIFLTHLPQGVWELRYDYRAEVPGYFHALPVVGQAMYVPEIRGNSAETRLTIKPSETSGSDR